ncbi:uncharacterized protein LOC131048397 isoform X2 [Cryptomeria japonica]|uniref:uncharacterized protein LOC131048397 isoform X2 n=1 Tax=Cryptomeria japonica TaxID=3369 RepID=UPI0025ACC952|nr:uncharacterized protein LOC131048397 isoform X2 [Cryptomeria japonica]
MADYREIGGLDDNSSDIPILFDFEEDIKRPQKCNEEQESMPRWMISSFQDQTHEGFERATQEITGCSGIQGQAESSASVNSSPRCFRCNTPDQHVLLAYRDTQELDKALRFVYEENESVESVPGYPGSACNDYYLFNIATTVKRIYDRQQQQISRQQQEIFQQYQEIFQQQQHIFHMNEIITTLYERVSQLERRQEVSNGKRKR